MLKNAILDAKKCEDFPRYPPSVKNLALPTDLLGDISAPVHEGGEELRVIDVAVLAPLLEKLRRNLEALPFKRGLHLLLGQEPVLVHVEPKLLATLSFQLTNSIRHVEILY